MTEDTKTQSPQCSGGAKKVLSFAGALCALVAGGAFAGFVAVGMTGDAVTVTPEPASPPSVVAAPERAGEDYLIDTTLPVNEIKVPVFDTVEMPLKRKEAFESGVDGLVAWHVSINGDDTIIYTTDNGKYAVLGMVVGENGTNITQKHVMEKIGSMEMLPQPLQGPDKAKLPSRAPKAKSLNPDDAWKAVTTAPFSFSEGTGPIEIYVTFDPRCPYCHRYAGTLKDLHDELTVHWIPIAVLGPESDTQAQLLVDAEDPLKLHHRIMAGETIQVSKQPSEQATETILGNTRIAFAAGLKMTPVTVAQTKDGPIALPGAVPAHELMARVGK